MCHHLKLFLNHIIPNDFIYKTIRKGKNVGFNKEEIESPKVSFRDKLIDVIPQWRNDPDFWVNHITQMESILELYENRKNLIHLKTNSQDDLERYSSVVDKMLDLDIFKCINAIIKFMNLAVVDFVELELNKEQKHNSHKSLG